ncbi:MAG: hypothetical protein HFF40_11900 [Lawsonibacter sp.]|jgi:hypothetical protein|nr:hypothetical protein [Lawsonibacter sp.]
MSRRLSHATLSRLEEGALRLVDHIEDITARRELIRLAQREYGFGGDGYDLEGVVCGGPRT